MEFIVEIALLLILAKVLGEACERLNLSSVVGYITAGVLLGPMFANAVPPESVEKFAQLGTILLLFAAGYNEVDVNEFMKQRKASLSVAIFGYLAPAAAAALVGWMFNLPLRDIVLLVVIVSASSMSTTIKTLIDLDKLKTRMGKVVLGSAVVDDVAGLAIFTVVMSVVQFGRIGFDEMAQIGTSIFAFMIVFLAAEKIIPYVVNISKGMVVEEAQFTMGFIIILVLASLVEGLGFSGILGAFLAGVILSRTRMVKRKFSDKLSTLAYGIFVPVFFAWTGLLVNIKEITAFFIVLSIAVSLANVIGAYFGARIAGMENIESLGTGLSMIPRGEVNVIMISLLMSAGVLQGATGDVIFGATMFMVLATTIVTPVALNIALAGKKLP